jgi:hypothetical protein
MARLIIAIIAGLLVGIILSIATDLLMVKLGIFPPFESDQSAFSNGLLLVASAYRAVYSILGALVIAVIAKEKYMKAVIIAGIIGTILALTGLIVMWEKSKSVLWYPISLVVLAIPYSLLGAKIYERFKLRKSSTVQ